MKTNKEIVQYFESVFSLREWGFAHTYYDTNLTLWRKSKIKNEIFNVSFTPKVPVRYAGFGTGIHFIEVENPLRELFPKYDFYHPGHLRDTLVFDDKNLLNQLFKDLSFFRTYDLTIKENIEELAGAIKSQFVKHILPFYDRYQTVQDVYDKIVSKVPQMELTDYIPGSYMSLKKQIILKLCNDPEYNSYAQWLTGIFETRAKENPDEWEKRYLLTKELTEFLGKM